MFAMVRNTRKASRVAGLPEVKRQTDRRSKSWDVRWDPFAEFSSRITRVMPSSRAMVAIASGSSTKCSGTPGPHPFEIPQ